MVRWVLHFGSTRICIFLLLDVVFNLEVHKNNFNRMQIRLNCSCTGTELYIDGGRTLWSTLENSTITRCHLYQNLAVLYNSHAELNAKLLRTL
jgi:hypothetical protein